VLLAVGGAAAVHSFILHEDISKTKPADMMKTASWQLEALALLPQMFMHRLADDSKTATNATDLAALSVKELKRRARALGATDGAIEDLDDADDVKVATIALIGKLNKEQSREKDSKDSSDLGSDSDDEAHLPPVRTKATTLHFVLRGASRAIPAGIFLASLSANKSAKIKTMVVQLAGVIASTFYCALIAGGDTHQQKLLRLGLAPLLLTFAIAGFTGMQQQVGLNTRQLAKLVPHALPNILLLQSTSVPLMLLAGGPTLVTAFYLISIPMLNKAGYLDLTPLWNGQAWRDMKRQLGF